MCFIILPQLAPVRKRELFFIFAVAAHEDAYRRARKIETAAQRIFKIALVAEMHKVGVVDLDDESRRRDRNFRDVKQFQLFAEFGGRLAYADCVLQHFVEQPRGDSPTAVCKDLAAERQYPVRALPRHRGDVNGLEITDSALQSPDSELSVIRLKDCKNVKVPE